MKYPIGIQSFEEIREKDFVYIDKTKYVYDLWTRSGNYFFARPRRFGKSLLLSTLEALALGKKHLFKGLWIEDKVTWEKYAVVHITFNTIGYQSLGLEAAIVQELKRIGTQYGVMLEQNYAGLAFRELIDKIAVERQVVILIDEYDKPIIDYLEDIPQAKANQQLLKSFYAVLKNAKRQIRFLFVTGVSKFSRVSIFSDLNNLLDITFNPRFSYLVGYAPNEVRSYFEADIKKVGTKLKLTEEAIWKALKVWYNGYSWDGEQFVYNPFSILCCLEEQRLRNFWFTTGTPSFLIRLLKERFIYRLESMQVDDTVFESYNIEDLGIKSLLFQTGYLTIKAVNEHGIYTLDYPNEEVRISMFKHLIPAFRNKDTGDTTPMVFQLSEAFQMNNLEKVISIINTLFKSIPNQIFIANAEAYYHSIIHLVFSYLGHFIESEINTSDGRIDAIVQTSSHIYIFEFKLDQSARIGLEQIRDKDYGAKYRHLEKDLVGIAINFSSTNKAVDGWEMINL